jgi:ribonuclease HI
LKGNPLEAGAGRIILDPEANQELHFAWGIGVATNNKVEALALHQGLSLLKTRGIDYITIV